MYRLAHLSDLHIGPLPDMRIRDLMSKRFVGWINWQRNRKKALASDHLHTLLADIADQAPDHVAVTGDLINLGLAGEYESGRDQLEQIGTAHNTSFVPGNHDTYVPGAMRRVTEHWAPFITGDDAENPTHFPFVRRRGPLTLIGVSTAVATPPFLATGRIGPAQRDALASILADPAIKSTFRVILIHHPPTKIPCPWHKRLSDAKRFRAVLNRHGAELVLHGHTHLPTTDAIPGPVAPVPVIGVASASQTPDGHRPPAAWNLFEISGQPGAWQCQLTRRGFQKRSSIVTELDRLTLWPQSALDPSPAAH